MILLALSLFCTEPVPLEMPRAEAYLVRDGASLRLEDRYDQLDLWTSRAVDGRWVDEDGRVFLTATLSECPPPALDDETRPAVTRCEYASLVRPVDEDDERALSDAIALLSPVFPAEKGERADRRPKGISDLVFWQGTNSSSVVCTYRAYPRRGRSRPWKLACWTLAEGDDFKACLEKFDEEFLRRELKAETYYGGSPEPPKGLSERELLRADARHSVAAYGNWRVTDSEEFVVLDDLTAGREAVAVLTNEFKVMRARYAEAMPTGVDGSNVLAVARLFGSRDEYLDALAADGLTNLSWSAAYWSQSRRELVAFLPKSGVEDLISTVRHEAFHQYLSYAASMISVSPWLNEGYAQYFEGDGLVDDHDGMWTGSAVELGAAALPPLLSMDYSAFYAGTDEERTFKYRLAQSVAVFIERGAPLVRFRPFADLKERYFKALFDTKDMSAATAAAFGSKEKLELFVDEWKTYMTEGRFKTKDSQ